MVSEGESRTGRMVAIGGAWATTLTILTAGVVWVVGVVTTVNAGCLNDEMDSATLAPRCSLRLRGAICLTCPHATDRGDRSKLGPQRKVGVP